MTLQQKRKSGYYRNKKKIQLALKILKFILLSFIVIAANAQSRVISGIVLDEDEEPAIGVNIVVKDTDNGAVTDPDGIFTIELQAGQHEIEVSYIGYIKQNIDVSNLSEVIVALQLDEIQFQEVVNFSYGRPKTKTFLSHFRTNLVDKLKTEDIDEADLVVVVCLFPNHKDMDLYVREPTEEVCNYVNDKTKIGGQLMIDVIDGIRFNYKTEIYVIKKAASGKYSIMFDSNSVSWISDKAEAYINVYRNLGRKNEKVTSKVINIERGSWFNYSSRSDEEKIVMTLKVR